MKSKDCFGRGYFSPDFSPGIPRRRIESFEVLPAIQRNPRVQVKFVLVRSFWSRYGKNKTVIEMFYTSEHFRKHWKCGESTCWYPEHMGKCEAVKESQTDWARLSGLSARVDKTRILLTKSKEKLWQIFVSIFASV